MFSWWKAYQAERLLLRSDYCLTHLVPKRYREYSLTLKDGTVARGTYTTGSKICTKCERDAEMLLSKKLQAAIDLLKADKHGN